jgi:hypothetical protein
MEPKKKHQKSNRVVGKEAACNEITCPSCRHSWRVNRATREAILTALEGWDRRYDRAAVIVEDILELIGQA